MRAGKLSLNSRLKKIRCLLLDVDGVLTDGKLHFTSDGEEFKSFDVQDGHGIAMAQRAGLRIGFVSGRPSQATTRRAADLGVTIVLQQGTNKMELVEQIKEQHGFADAEIAFIGDELVDLPVLRRVGLAVAVPKAVPEVKRVAHYVTRRQGGDGAVREVIEMILKAQKSWDRVIAKYLVVLACALVPVFAHAGTNEAATGYIEKFEVPEWDEAGNLQWKLMGDRAQLRMDGTMDIQNVRAEFYQSNKVAMVLSAPQCLLDRAKKHAATDGPVLLESPEMTVQATGASWDQTAASVILRSNVHVQVRSGAMALPELGGKTK
jgi:3-deoxy-D-manno-octulosonate 8-phosphate phosphatase (KDO 8-P phosphatase)